MKNEKAAAKPETAVKIKDETSVAATTPPTIPGLVASDIIIPKVLLMQGMSELVKQRKAQLGDIVRSTTGEKLGDPEHAVQFIPLSFPESFWIIEVQEKEKYEFRKMIPRNAKNSGLEWNFVSDAQGNELPVPAGNPGSFKARRVQRLAFYALLPGDVEADMIERKKAEGGEFPDFSKALMPVLIACRSLSFQAGKEVVSFFTQVASFKRQAWEAILELKCHLEQNDKGSFYVYDVDRAKPKPVKKEHLETVQYWANVVNTQTLRVDESADEDAATTATTGNQF